MSHETIYQCLYVQTRGSLRADLHQCLSTKRTARKSRGRIDNRRGAYSSGEEFRISDRPPEVADRAVPGHWEGDLIVGPNNSAIGTLVERSTRFVLLLHLPGNHTADTVATAMIDAMRELPEHLRRSITWDRGSEMAHWRRHPPTARRAGLLLQPAFAVATRQQRKHQPTLDGSGSRRAATSTRHTKADLKRIQDTLNRRPRPTLNLDTPAQRLAALLDQAA